MKLRFLAEAVLCGLPADWRSPEVHRLRILLPLQLSLSVSLHVPLVDSSLEKLAIGTFFDHLIIHSSILLFHILDSNQSGKRLCMPALANPTSATEES